MDTPETLTDYLKGKTCEGFKPVPRYSLAGDMFEVYIEGEPGCTVPVNEFLTIVRAFSDSRILGVKVFGVAAMVDAARAEELATLAHVRQPAPAMLDEVSRLSGGRFEQHQPAPGAADR